MTDTPPKETDPDMDRRRFLAVVEERDAARDALAALTKERDKLVSSGVEEINAERIKQLAKWGPEHDDGHTDHELICEAADLLDAARDCNRNFIRDQWGLVQKHKDTRKRLIIAGALVAAEIDRMDRAALAATEGEQGGAR